MSNEIPEGWPGIVAAILGVVGWFMTLERRLSNKMDRSDAEDMADEVEEKRKQLAVEIDIKRDKERERVDVLFKEILERIDRREHDNTQRYHEINKSLNDINVRLARQGLNGNGK